MKRILALLLVLMMLLPAASALADPLIIGIPVLSILMYMIFSM